MPPPQLPPRITTQRPEITRPAIASPRPPCRPSLVLVNAMMPQMTLNKTAPTMPRISDADAPPVAFSPGFRRRVERVAAEGGSDRCCRGVLRELGIAVVSEALHRGVTGVVGCVRHGQRGVHLAFVREGAGAPVQPG